LLPLTNSAINTFEGLINVNPLMPSGPVSFNVSAVDLAGNPFNGAPSGPALVIDLTPPSAVISTTPGAPVQATNNTAVAVNLRLTEEPKAGTIPTLNFGPPLGASVSLVLTGEGTNWNGTLTVTPEMGSGVGHFTLTVNDALDNVGHNITAGSALEIYNTGLPTPPAQPVGFQATSLSGGRVRLNWLVVSNAEIYRVYSAPGTNLTAPTTLVADNISSNSYIHLPATDGNYRYVVTALRRGSESTNSIVRVAVSDRTPPPAPTNIALQLAATGLRVTWQATAGETPDHFSVYRNGTLIRTVGSSVTSINDTPPRGVMNYTVAAADVLGNEALSAPATIELLVGAVDNLQALVTLGGAPKLTWASSDSTAVAFNVYRNGIKQNASPISGTTFTDALPANGAIVTYAVRALNSTNAESAARTVDVHAVDLRLSINESGGTIRPPTGRYFDKYHLTLANVTTIGALPLRQVEVRRTSTAGTFNLVDTIGNSVNSGASLVRDLAVPCAADNSAQTVRLRAIQETDIGGSSVIYEASFEFPTVEAPGVMMEVSANAQPLAGGLNSFDVRVYNRGYATMFLATTRGNGADPGDLSIIVRNPQGQEVSRQAFTGSPAGIIFSGGVGYVAIASGASLSLTVPGVLVPEALSGDIVTFEAVATAIYDRFSATGQQQSGPLSGSMQSSLAQTPYYGSAQTDSPVYSNDQPIIISGKALDRATGLPRANVPLKIGFATRGFRWYRDVTTDAAGNYSYTYTPGPGLAGSLTIWAAHPDVVDQLNQARVNIYRLYPSPASGDVRMSKSDTLDFSIVMFNPGDQALTDFTVSAQVFEVQGTNRTLTTKVTGSLLSDTNFSVAAGQRQSVNLQLAAVDDAPNNAIAVFTFTSSEGASAEFTANVSLLPAVPIISVISPEVGYVDVSVDRGNLLSRSVTIANRGLKDLLGVTLARPTNETWMALNLPVSADGSISLPDLKVGQSNTFTVVFAPSTNTALGFHQDKIVVRGTNSTATFDVNLYARVTSDQFGAVQVYVDNILGADVPNATVRLRNTTLQVELPPAYTDINGLVTITNLQEGDWSWQVNAPGHSANVGVIQVVPSQTVQVATRLNKSVVTINFSVVPVPFTDRYEIKLEQTFETHVPVPVLVMTPAYMQFDNVKPGFEASYIVTVKNEGLIQMENLTIKGSQSASATFTPLITYVPILLPQQTVEIPMHVTYSSTQAQSQQSNPLSDCLPNPLGFLDDIGPFTEGLAALANAEGRCVKDNTLLMCAGAVAMGMKIFGDVTSVLSSVAEQAASYIGCVIGSLLSNFGSGIGGGGGGGGEQQSVQNFAQGGSICFSAETRVMLADGRLKMISEIKTGDFVKTGPDRSNVAHVAEVFALTSDRVRDLHFTWPGTGRSDSVRTTDEHLFWVDGKGWVEAQSLHVGDWLLDDTARSVQVTESRRYEGTLPVYTFRLREDPSFYANGILVHDMCGFVRPDAIASGEPPGPPASRVASQEGATK
jgi:large repetitive protein